MSFNIYSGTKYLMIDAATQYGKDKATFEERIEWTRTNLNNLESLVKSAKEKPLYVKAVNAIRDTQLGIETGHMVGMDASSSGLQIMSAAMGCHTGALNTGLIDSNKMPDAYTTCTDLIKMEIGFDTDVNRDDAKQAIMTFFYGSEAKPKEIFEEGSSMYVAFFTAAYQLAPEAYDLRNILISIWQPGALQHSWTLPDGFTVIVKNMVKKDVVIKVPELNSSFTHIFMENEGSDRGVSLAANVIHSIDGMIVREMNRRCNYDKEKLQNIQYELLMYMQLLNYPPITDTTKILTLAEVMNTIWDSTVTANFVARAFKLVNNVLSSQPFELVCVHDEFKCHPNNMNIVRYWYKEILAEIADSHIIQDIIRQICNNNKLTITRASENLGNSIRESNYALG